MRKGREGGLCARFIREKKKERERERERERKGFQRLSAGPVIWRQAWDGVEGGGVVEDERLDGGGGAGLARGFVRKVGSCKWCVR